MSDRAIVFRSAYTIGVLSRDEQVDPHLRILGSPTGQHFFLVGRQRAALWFLNSQSGGLVCQECEEGSLKTQARLRFGADGTAGPLTRG